MFRFIVAPIAVLLSLVIPHSRHWTDSVKPLAWSTPQYSAQDMMAMWLGYKVDTSQLPTKVENHCTAWAYRPHQTLHWITAAHCVLDEETGAYEDHDYQVNGHLIYVEDWDQATDLAALVDADGSAPGLKIAKHDIRVEDPLVIRGYPFGYVELVTVKGFLAAPSLGPEDWPSPYNRSVYAAYQTAIAGGNSGSPVFNGHGEVIGVLQAGIGDPEGVTPIGLGSLTKVLREFVKRLD